VLEPAELAARPRRPVGARGAAPSGGPHARRAAQGARVGHQGRVTRAKENDGSQRRGIQAGDLRAFAAFCQPEERGLRIA